MGRRTVSNYLIKQGQKWSVKVAIPAELQGVFGKKAFKKSLGTSDKAAAIARSGPLIAEFKDAIASARGNPEQHLDDYLAHTQAHLRTVKGDPDVNPDAIEGMEEETLQRLLQARGVQHPEQLSGAAEAEAVKVYQVVVGQQTLFNGPLDEYIKSRKVEPKTAAKDRHAVEKFAAKISTVEEVDRQAVRNFVAWLSAEDGLKNRTIRDNLSTLRVYWKWLVDRAFAPEDRPNPFADVAPTSGEPEGRRSRGPPALLS